MPAGAYNREAGLRAFHGMVERNGGQMDFVRAANRPAEGRLIIALQIGQSRAHPVAHRP
jgi:hypothetical protein